MATFARLLFVGLLAALGFGLVGRAAPIDRPAAVPLPAREPPAHTVYLAGALSDEGLISLGAAVASRPDALLLLDSRPLTPYLKHFLGELKPQRVVAVGKFAEDAAALSKRLDVKVEAVLPWSDPAQQALSPRVERLVVCPAKPRSLLLDAACLASVEGAPLWVLPPQADAPEALRQKTSEWKTKQVFLVGDATPLKLEAPRATKLPAAADVRSAYWRKLGSKIDRAVVTNPADLEDGMGGTSALAPWLAVRRRAALLSTSAKGTDAAEIVRLAASRSPLTKLDTVILLGNLQAIPMQQRPNPIPDDKDKAIDMEPLTPRTGEPFSYAIGRLFHDDRAVVPLMLARQQLMASKTGPRSALVASNPGGGLPLLETFSRSTSRELKNAGWDVTSLYGHQVTAKELRKQMVGPDLFLWEGHHNTLVKEWGFTKWDEPMPPTFVFLQSCLALMPEKVEPLLARGAVGVLGTSTRTYSGSGGAFSLAFLDGCVYEDRTTGDSLRQAKNFLVCYAQLKQKRLAGQATRTGANTRASWAFTLWGDPTFKIPCPPRPDSSLPIVRSAVSGNTVVVEVPAQSHGKVTTAKYRAEMPANGRLAGLLRKDEEGQPLVPMLFAEVRLPRAPAGLTPRLRSRLPSGQWVFVWDARRKTGYLLVMAPRHESGELRFRVEWPGPSVVGRTE
jgi:hypothetical protein